MLEQNNEQFYYGGHDDRDPWDAVDVDIDPEEEGIWFIANFNSVQCPMSIHTVFAIRNECNLALII